MNVQLSLFENNFQVTLSENDLISPDEKKQDSDEEGVIWAYSKTRTIDKGNGITEILPAKLKADGTPKKYPLNSRKGNKRNIQPIRKETDQIAVLQYLVDHEQPKYALAFQIGINIGLRVDELVSLRWEDLLSSTGIIRSSDGTIRLAPRDDEDLSDRIYVYQKKTHSDRGIHLNQACIDIINWYWTKCNDDYGFVFKTRESGHDHLGEDSIYKAMKRAMKHCGLHYNVATHTLRKTFGYRQFKSRGGDWDAVLFLQGLFGHASPTVTMRYIGVYGEEMKKAYLDVVTNPLTEIL